MITDSPIPIPRSRPEAARRGLRHRADRRDPAEVRRDLAAWLAKWQGKYAKLCAWVEENIEETLTYYRLPLAHHKHMKSTNMLERLNQEIKRRTQLVRIFPDAASCLRLVRVLAVETHENWLEAIRCGPDLVEPGAVLAAVKDAARRCAVAFGHP